MPTTWKFVATPEASPTVLLDMEDGATWKTLGGDFFQLPSPPLRRSIVTNNLTDGGLVGAANYDLRELKFTVEMKATTEAGRIAQVDALKRELARPRNLLMFKPQQGANPVFFRTFRSDAYDLNTQFIPGVAWRMECSVLAEPFAIGLRHDIVVNATVQNDPASGTNPTRIDITDVRGDHPSPAVVRIGSGFGANAVFWLAARTRNNPAALTVWAQCEGGTLGADTTTQVNDTAMSGAGNNYVRTTFATDNNLTTRVTVTVPTASSTEALRGRYRVLVKLRRSGGNAFMLRYRLPGASGSPGPLTSYSTAQANTTHLDLGVADFPSPGPSPQAIGYSGLTAGFSTQAIDIQAQRTAGTGNLDFDYVYLLPADEAQCSLQQIATTGYIVLDGPNDAVYGMATGTSLFGATVADRVISNGGGLMTRQGDVLKLVPGVTNRWYLLRTNFGATSTSVWDVSYWPYWLEVATS